MTVLEALAARRAVKHYDPRHHMPEEILRAILEAAMLAPTAFNIQHWRFVRVLNPELRRRIRAAAWDQAQVTDASVLLVMTADVQAWRKSPERYWPADDGPAGPAGGAPRAVVDFLLPAIDAYYRGRPQVQRDECMRSLGLVSMAVMLAAQEFGYDSCPMDGFDFEAVGRLINLPPDHLVGLMLALGKKTRDAWPRIGRLSLNELLVENHFS